MNRRAEAPALRRGCALAVLSGTLLVLAYPPFSLSALGWCGLAPLIAAVRGVRPRAAAGLGWLCGTALGLGVAGYWLWRAAVDYFGLGALLAALFVVALIEVFVAPFWALFGALVAAGGGRVPRLLFVPAAFVACEYLRATLVGNAWELLGHSQRALPVLQIVDVTGVYGLSFALALTATALADLAASSAGGADRSPYRASAWRVAAAGVLVAALLIYGAWRLGSAVTADARLEALLVQGDVSNPERGRPERAADAVRHYLALSESVRPVPAVVLWPENAIAVFPQNNAPLLASVQAFGRNTAAVVLAGGPRAGDRAGTAALYNSVYQISGEGVRPVYDKQRLLPFVERFTLRRLDGPYAAGDAVAPLRLAGARAGILICFEIIYPDLARALVESGADVLVNFSNDSWFDAGAGPAQHYELARFRAIENRVSLLRITNSGISGAFDPLGREIARLPVGVASAQTVGVPLRGGGSFYTRHGDWFAWLCLLAVAAQLARAALRRRAARADRHSISAYFSSR